MSEEKAQAIYDADADQRMPFQTERKGKLYNVAHIFGPIKDENVIEFERGRNQRITDAEVTESDDSDAMAVSSTSFQSAVNYWDTTGTRAEGYSSEVSIKDKAYAVQNLLFAVEFDKLPLASSDELCPPDDDDNSSYRLRSLFDGKLVVTEHTLRAGSPDELAEFQSLMGRALLVRGTQFGQTDQRIPSRARGLGILYDKVKIEVKGYAKRVPLHHKMAVALHHFRAQQRALTGNSSASPQS